MVELEAVSCELPSEVKELKKTDPVAFFCFAKYVAPEWENLSGEEKELVLEFLEYPFQGIGDIVKWYGKRGGRQWSFYEFFKEVGDLPVPKMTIEYARRKGWAYEGAAGGPHLIWETYTFIPTGPVPRCLGHLRELKGIRKWAAKAKGKMGIIAYVPGEIGWHRCRALLIDHELASEALGREVYLGEELSLKEALKVIDHVIQRWEKFLQEARKKGWTYLDEEGEESWIWERNFRVSLGEDLSPKSGKDWEKLRELREALVLIRERKAGNFLKFLAWDYAGHSRERRITWTSILENVVYIDCKAASEALGRKVGDGEELTIEETIKVVNWIFLKKLLSNRPFLFLQTDAQFRRDHKKEKGGNV